MRERERKKVITALLSPVLVKYISCIFYVLLLSSFHPSHLKCIHTFYGLSFLSRFTFFTDSVFVGTFFRNNQLMGQPTFNCRVLPLASLLLPSPSPLQFLEFLEKLIVSLSPVILIYTWHYFGHQLCHHLILLQDPLVPLLSLLFGEPFPISDIVFFLDFIMRFWEGIWARPFFYNLIIPRTWCLCLVISFDWISIW